MPRPRRAQRAARAPQDGAAPTGPAITVTPIPGGWVSGRMVDPVGTPAATARPGRPSVPAQPAGPAPAVGPGDGHGRHPGSDPALFVLVRQPYDVDGSPLGPAELARRMDTGTGLGGIGAPFAAATVTRAGRVTAAADHAGLRHLYATRADGWAAIGTSALDLARLRGGGLDLAGLGEYRLIGHYLDERTAYRGVTKLAPASLWRLAGGALEHVAYPCPERQAGCEPRQAARHHAQRLRELVGGFLDHHPDAMIELSGGLDSRLVLAAIDPARRVGLHALTLTFPGAADGTVAAGLARRYGMEHHTVDVSRLSDISVDEAYQRVLAAAHRTGALGGPLSMAVFDWAEQQVPATPRLGGHGGEVARGFYHMQRQHPRVEPYLVDRLARWWIMSNNAVADEALEPGFAQESRQHVSSRLQEIFAGYRTDWLTATDEFYLRQRLHRWAGLTLTDAALCRVVANPLLDPQVLAYARAVPRPYRSNSRYTVQVLDLLDPELARLRLASGLRPITLSRRLTLARRLDENTLRGFARKAADKVNRRLRASGRPPVGAAAMAQLVTERWRAEPGLLHPVLRTGVVCEQWLARFLAGEVGATPATVDFLVNLQVMVDAGATGSGLAGPRAGVGSGVGAVPAR